MILCYNQEIPEVNEKGEKLNNNNIKDLNSYTKVYPINNWFNDFCFSKSIQLGNKDSNE